MVGRVKFTEVKDFVLRMQNRHGILWDGARLDPAGLII